MTDPKIIAAIITALGALVTAVIVEVVRRAKAQRATDETLHAVLSQISPNSGSSMHDAVGRIERDVREIREEQKTQGQRLSAVEARVSDHLGRN